MGRRGQSSGAGVGVFDVLSRGLGGVTSPASLLFKWTADLRGTRHPFGTGIIATCIRMLNPARWVGHLGAVLTAERLNG